MTRSIGNLRNTDKSGHRLAILIKPPYEQAIAEHLLPVACFCNIKHRLVAVCFKEFFDKYSKGLPTNS